jgi:hypothetical protein
MATGALPDGFCDIQAWFEERDPFGVKAQVFDSA